MTDREAAKVLEKMISRGWLLTKELDAALPVALAALRQPRLPKEWPLKWKKERFDGKWIWSAQSPINTAAVAVVVDRPRIRPRVAGVWWSVGKYFGYCTTAWSARRAAARAVARAVRESAEGGAK